MPARSTTSSDASNAERVGGPAREPSARMTLQTVERALSFLDFVARAPTPPTVRDAAEALGVNITTCYHLFNTLLARGFIERNPDSTLRIGFEAAVLYDGYRRGATESVRMSEFVTALAQQTQETAWVSRLVGDRVVLTAFEDGPQPVRAVGLVVGLSGQEHIRSSGRAVLAFVDDDHRDRILSTALAHLSAAERARTARALKKELAEVRERGWALDDEGYNAGILGIAAPYFDSAGEVLGAVGVWAPSTRGHATLDGLVADVTAAGARATATLGRS